MVGLALIVPSQPLIIEEVSKEPGPTDRLADILGPNRCPSAA